MKNKNKEFIGVDYETDIEKKNILDSLSSYEMNKLLFLNETQHNENTKKSYYSIYKTSVLTEEEFKGKDLMNFTYNELEDLLLKLFNTSVSYRATLLAFMKTYFLYHQKITKNININPLDYINEKLLKRWNRNPLITKYIDLSKFYNYCKIVEKEDNINTVMPMLLARYGITGEGLEWMRSIKWIDIDSNNLKANILDNDENLITSLPIDNNFINWIEKYKGTNNYETSSKNKKASIVSLIDYGYILKKNCKKSSNDGDIKENKSGLYNRNKIFCDIVKIKRVSFNNLVESRRMDMILKLRATRKITDKDLESIVYTFNPSIKQMANAVINLTKKYETLTCDKVLKYKSITEDDLVDNNAEEFVNKISKDINFKFEEVLQISSLDFLENLDEKDIGKKIKDKYTIRLIKCRNGQDIYRKSMLLNYKKCQICGLENNKLLVASHLKTFSKSNLDECIDFNNGMLLCNKHDSLIDSGLISFENNGNILISSELSDGDLRILELNNQIKVKLEPEQLKFIKWHREEIFNK